MVFYAMPCASVLVLELFRLVTSPQPRPSTSTRSAIIQDISVLISCCDLLIESGQSNYGICKQAQLIFSRALDQILNQEDSTVPMRSLPDNTLHSMHDVELGTVPDMHTEEPVVQEAQWEAWLESVDFEDDTWLEMLKPPNKFFCTSDELVPMTP